MKRGEKHVPALNFNPLTPLYDPLVKWLLPESKFKSCLVGQARIRARQKVLDVGCGTATLTVLIKKAQPGALVFGLDGDAKILGIACRKAENAGMEVSLAEGLACCAEKRAAR